MIFPFATLSAIIKSIVDAPDKTVETATQTVRLAVTGATGAISQAVDTVTSAISFSPLAWLWDALSDWKQAVITWAGHTSLYGVVLVATMWVVRWAWGKVRSRDAATWLRWQIAGSMSVDTLVTMLQQRNIKAMSGGGQLLLVNAYHAGVARRFLSSLNVPFVEVR